LKTEKAIYSEVCVAIWP